jgi:hypothetical protein
VMSRLAIVSTTQMSKILRHLGFSVCQACNGCNG